MRLRSTVIYGLLLTGCIGYLVFLAGGVQSICIYHSWFALGLLGIIVFGFSKAQPSPRLEPIALISWALLLLYIAVQAVPLPSALTGFLSPGRRELSSAVSAVTAIRSFMPISINSAATIEQLIRMAGYFLVFLMARELLWRAGDRQHWKLVVPIAAIAALEAVLGVSQFVLSGGSVSASGTYVNRNHFGGLLGMTLPLAIAYTGTAIVIAANRPLARPANNLIQLCLWGALSGAILAGVLCSSSRMTLVACLIASISTLYLVFRPTLPGLLSIVLGAFLLIGVLVPTVYVDRFALLTVGDTYDAQIRLELWKDTLSIVRTFPITGSGAGTYSTALIRYKTVAPSHDAHFAHNDYLQYLSELGFVGFMLLAVLGVFLVWRAVTTALNARNPEQRAVAAGCTGALLSIAIHSLVDFNSYIPANAAVLAFISGITVALPYLSSDQLKRVQAPRPGWIRLRRSARGIPQKSASPLHVERT